MKSHLFVAAALSLTINTGVLAQSKEFVYVSPSPIGVNPFLRMGESGIRAAAEMHGAKASVIESDTPQSRLENVSGAANDGADIIVVLGFEFNDIILDVAPTAPDTQFLIVDQCIFEDRPDNVHCAIFREHEAAFLMGAIAGLNTKTNKVGAVSALDIPFLHRFTDGFQAGATHVNPDVEYDVRWVGGQNPFQDPVRAKELALSLAATGVDVLFSATSGGDFGVFEAAAEKDFKVLSVDVNHCGAAPDHVLDSALKRVDQALTNSINAIVAGETSTVAAYGLKEAGMGSHASSSDDILNDSGCLIAEQPETVAMIRTLAQQIIDGELVVNDPMQEN